jgi:hypothetical protein
METRLTRKTWNAISLAIILALVFAPLALADDVKNDVVSNPPSITLVAGDPLSYVVVDFYIQPTSNDGDPQCNFDTSTESLTFTINTPSGVIANPSSLTFNKCKEGNATNEQEVSFNANSSAESGYISFTITANNTGGSFRFDDAVFYVYVTGGDNTPPILTLPSDITAEATGPGGAEVSFTATATDLVDGDVEVTCDPASGSTFSLGETEVSCSATDAAGNTGYGSFKITVVDTTPPVVTVPDDITEEATGPSGAVVTFTASAEDIVDDPLTPTCDPVSGSTFPLGGTEVTCSATDAAGNTGSASFNVTVVDTTPPDLTLPSNIEVLATGPDGAVVNFSATATDLVDGTVAVICSPASGSLFPIGTTTVNCSATDAAGNAASGSFTVKVKLSLYGFYQPVDMDKLNTVKGGSTVPLKFEIFAGDTELTDTSYVQSLEAQKVTCDAGLPEDTIEMTATGNTSLRYDGIAGQFIYNWQTPKGAGICYLVTMTTIDGSTLVANFKTK